MLNTLANHGYLPHNGKDITERHTINALYNALGIEEELAIYLHQEAVTTNPAPNATTFSLNDLSRHDILEHDASLRYVPQTSYSTPHASNKLSIIAAKTLTSATTTTSTKPSSTRPARTGLLPSST